ncbi:unnamed protein product [Prorocentrum cordatum]|uniref:Uncharacterized protein n=1 Tax=Prorocentrum cordatum TaxID=2364126 RepID=A0ABN9Y9M9_9DINO|nr:unnamed protein product [Polarella glacialis]
MLGSTGAGQGGPGEVPPRATAKEDLEKFRPAPPDGLAEDPEKFHLVQPDGLVEDPEKFHLANLDGLVEAPPARSPSFDADALPRLPCQRRAPK